MNQSMNTQDAVSANYAECFVTIDGTRYSMLMAKEFEGKATINTKEVYKLGNPVVGHKAQTMALAFSMTRRPTVIPPVKKMRSNRSSSREAFSLRPPSITVTQAGSNTFASKVAMAWLVAGA